tara:strand:- start:4322 stop:4528 length:207 start_codon:yes stop_codon:yes gene_type:complete
MLLMNIPSSVKFTICLIVRFLFAERAVVTTATLCVGEPMASAVKHLGCLFGSEVFLAGHCLAFGAFAE